MSIIPTEHFTVRDGKILLVFVVDLDTAKSLKENGFNKKCEHFWLDRDLHFVHRGLKKTKNGQVLNHNRSDEFIYSAPLIEVAEKWLKNNKGKKGS